MVRLGLGTGIAEMNGERDAILASIFAASLDSIIVVDADGCVADFNPAAEQTFGYERSQ